MAIERARQEVGTDFIVERYHRAFDDELVVIRALVRAPTVGTRLLARAMQQLEARLKTHALLQEMRIFPAFDGGAPREQSLIEAHAMDALMVSCAVDALRAASREVESSALGSRINHLLDEIQDHLALEARLLAPWLEGMPQLRDSTQTVDAFALRDHDQTARRALPPTPDRRAATS